MNNLFLVKSPLQLLNAIEASCNYASANNYLILRYTSNQRTNSQMQNLLKINEWTKIFIINYSRLPVNFLNEFLLLKKLIRSKIAINDIFIGDYRLLNFRIFAINLEHRKLYLLDDGTSTFTVQDFYLNENKDYSEPFFLGNLKKFIARSFFRLKTTLKEKVHLFTCYNIHPHKEQEIKINNYQFTKSYLKRNTKVKINPDKIYYIGAKYVEANLMQEETYLQLLKNVQQKHLGKRLIYVPHRGENIRKLSKIENLDIDIEYFNNIVEIEFLFHEELPSTLCGFTSSVLVNIPKIYPQINVIVYKVDKELFAPSYRETVNNFYKRFQEGEGLKLNNI